MAGHRSLLLRPRATTTLQDPGAEPLLRVDFYNSFEYTISKGVRSLVAYTKQSLNKLRNNSRKRKRTVTPGRSSSNNKQHVLLLKPGVAPALCKLCAFKETLYI